MHVIGTAGHVDHGKSTLVQKLTGTDPDRLAEEKQRGLTIDLGFAHLTLPSGRSAGIVDVPGHERFIRNMLAGAGGINVCLFVVAANEGWKPQTSEHLAIVDILGVTSGVVALTKSDSVDDGELEAVTEDIRARMLGTTLAAAPIVPVSARTGTGLDDLLATLDDVLENTPPAADLGSPRLWIDRVFTIAGAGTVVTGTLAGGSFHRGDEISIAPEGRNARIRSIQSHNRELESIPPGNRVALNLSGLTRQGADRGDAVVQQGRWRNTDRVDVRISLVSEELAGREHHLTDKGAHLLYTGSAETPVRVKLIGAKRIDAGGRGYAQLQLRAELPLARGDRFVLRDVGRVLTLGGGVVLDPLATPLRGSDDARVSRLRAMDGAGPEVVLRTLLDQEGAMDVGDALWRAGTAEPPPEARRLGSLLVSSARLTELQTALLAILDRHHHARPLEKGRGLEVVRSELRLPTSSFEALVAATPSVAQEGSVLRLEDHSPTLAPAEEEARTRVLRAIEESGFTPPLAKDLDAEAALLRAMVEQGDLVAVGDFYL
ncbi:MAG: selenocysteine-specific elongation factor, partial [Actinomycetota bacterium]|nr:selenocysteine-specific elongation factor [Actinomycetota bacterium]